MLSRPDLLAGAPTADLAAAVATISGREDTIGALARTALVTRLDGDRLRLHRLVAEITRHRPIDADRDAADELAPGPAPTAWSTAAVDLIAGLLPGRPQDPDNWPIWTLLAAHATIATEHQAATAGVTLSSAVVLFQLGQPGGARRVRAGPDPA